MHEQGKFLRTYPKRAQTSSQVSEHFILGSGEDLYHARRKMILDFVLEQADLAVTSCRQANADVASSLPSASDDLRKTLQITEESGSSFETLWYSCRTVADAHRVDGLIPKSFYRRQR